MNNMPQTKLKIAAALLALGTLSVVLAQYVLAEKPKAEPAKLTPVMVQDFEKGSSPPKVWVVNIPDENASVQLSTDHPHDGKQCLKLHYHFVGTGEFQYLGIPNKTKIQAPVHKLRFQLYGDGSNCSYGVQVTDAHGETHQYGKNTGQGGDHRFHGLERNRHRPGLGP